MIDHLAHLQHPDVVAARAAWLDHYDACDQCQGAAGSPPPDCPAEVREQYACDAGVALHEAEVQAAQHAYRTANPEAFAAESE